MEKHTSKSQRRTYEDINKIIKEIEQILDEYDPIEIISWLSKNVGTINPETYVESQIKINLTIVEYFVSLALSKSYKESLKQPTFEVISKVLLLWKLLKYGLEMYFGPFGIAEKEDIVEAVIRGSLIERFLFVRGNDYMIHLEQTFLDLFESHSNHLKKTLGFSSTDYNKFLRIIEESITSALKQELQESGSKLDEFRKKVKLWQEIELQKDAESEDSRKHKNNQEKPSLEDIERSFASTLGSFNVFEIKPQCDVNRAILEVMSCNFGDNADFLTGPKKWRSWPTNDSIINSKPFVKFKKGYYLFHPWLLSMNRIQLFENLLEERSSRYYNRSYLPSRSKYVEKTALELIGKMLPKAKVHRNLYYDDVEDGASHVELDGLIEYDDCLIIIEAKAGSIPISAKRGSITKLRDNLKGILKSAHNQATRAIRYIKSDKIVQFYNKKREHIVSIENEKFKHIFIILVNFEPVYEISAHLSSAQRLNLLTGKDWPWFVYLNDLRVISDILEHPSLFLHYLKSRVSLNETDSIMSIDELDYFMKYLKTGLYFSKEQKENYDLIFIPSYTDELDAYYFWREGERSEVSKPRMKMDPTFQKLILHLETKMPHHFMSACLHLLDSDELTRSGIAAGIRVCEKHFKEDGEQHNASFRINGTGLLLGCMENISDYEELIDEWGKRWLDTMGVNKATAICWTPPVGVGDIRVFLFEKD